MLVVLAVAVYARGGRAAGLPDRRPWEHRRAVRGGPGARHRVPTGDAGGPPIRGPGGVREASDAVRGAGGVLRSDGDLVRHRRRASPHGAGAGRRHRRRDRPRLAPRRPRAPAGRGVASSTLARRSRSAASRTGSTSPAKPSRRSGTVASCSGPSRSDARVRPDEPVEGQARPRPGGAGGDGPPERAARRGPSNLSATTRGCPGRGAPAPRAEHPRRRPAAARRARGEGTARRSARGARPRKDRGAPRTDRSRDAVGARGPARPRSRHLPAAARGPGPGRGDPGPVPEGPPRGRGGCRRPRTIPARCRGHGLLLHARGPAERRQVRGRRSDGDPPGTSEREPLLRGGGRRTGVRSVRHRHRVRAPGDGRPARRRGRLSRDPFGARAGTHRGGSRAGDRRISAADLEEE